jgi:hypothetical protein
MCGYRSYAFSYLGQSDKGAFLHPGDSTGKGGEIPKKGENVDTSSSHPSSFEEARKFIYHQARVDMNNCLSSSVRSISSWGMSKHFL